MGRASCHTVTRSRELRIGLPPAQQSHVERERSLLPCCVTVAAGFFPPVTKQKHDCLKLNHKEGFVVFLFCDNGKKTEMDVVRPAVVLC